MNTEVEKKPRILVVEDEVNLADGIRFSLEHELYDVTLIHDGNEALTLLLTEPGAFDVIVLDIMLPGVNGFTICSQVREHGILTPIMFLSAKTLPEDKARGFDVGANQYLAKPFDLDEFLARIRNMLKLHQLQSAKEQEPAAELPEEMQIGNATVNFNTLEVRTPAKTHHLTFLEMTLLKYFVQNAKNNPWVITLSVLFDFFTNLMLAHYASDKSVNGLMREVGMNYGAAKDMTAALRNYSAWKAMENIALIRECDARQKGARGAAVPEDEVLLDLLYRLMH